ncbi:MAG: nitroreductase family protein [Tannerella sp.]|jgi:nitroreductase|nr:nitroreductase family protein [Tannerella sp.]
MTLLDLISRRRSVREYLTREIEPEKIDYIKECIRLAPSACNLQPWKFIFVQSDEKKALLQRCYDKEWLRAAPICVLALGDVSRSWKRGADGKDHAEIDVTIAFEHLILAAAEQGLGTCWICNFDVALARTLLNLPDNLIPVAITPLGYPAKKHDPVTNRKSIDEIVETE